MTYSSTNQNTLRNGRFLLLTTLALSCNIMADDAIRTKPLEDKIFNTEIEAVEAMSEHCLADSSAADAEHMGAVLQMDTGRFTVTHGEAEPGQTKVTFAILRPANSKVVALWHTHGAEGRKTERFSIQDNETVRDTGLPFYLIAPSGQISLLVDADTGLSHHLERAPDSHRLEAYRSYRGLALYRLVDATGSS